MPQAPTVELPKRLPLVISPENRDASSLKDSKLVNCYSEKTPDGDHWLYKRNGLAIDSQPPGTTANGYGMYNWLGDVYSIFGNKLYKNGAAVSGTVDTTNGLYKFASCLGATPKLQLGNGVKAYNYDDSNGLVLINDADFPATFVKGWSYLDGTTYVGRPDAGIQGDEINDPTAWDALNVIIGQIEPDRGVAVAKQLVYTILMKEWSTEVFYDAGNATGSPLAPVQGAKAPYGCVTSDSVVDIDGALFWVCTNRSSAKQIIKMEGLKVEIVSTPPIERILDEADFSTTYAFMHKDRGHAFYVLTLPGSNITLVYDASERMWSQWTDTDGNYFPFVASTFDSSLEHYLQHETDGRIYHFDHDYTNDNSSAITIDIVTPNFDGGTNRRKQMNVMKFVADQVPGSLLQVRKNDQDYAAGKWSNWRRVDLGQKQPMLTACGTFIRRAHHFRHQSDTDFRLRAIELQLDLGTL